RGEPTAPSTSVRVVPETSPPRVARSGFFGIQHSKRFPAPKSREYQLVFFLGLAASRKIRLRASHAATIIKLSSVRVETTATAVVAGEQSVHRDKLRRNLRSVTSHNYLSVGI